MSELNMLVRIVAKAERVEELIEQMLALREASRAEPGVLRYDIVRDIDSPDTFYMQESYADKAAFRSHARSAHMATYLELTKELVDQVNMHKVAHIEV